MKCPSCTFETESEQGFKQHMSKTHGGYSLDQLRGAGITPTRADTARALDSGRTSIADTVAGAPESETADEFKSKTTRGSSKASRAEAQQIAEFERLRPLLISKWKRRLRIPYSLWARLANDPEIALSETEATEGAEMHVELMQAMGWLRAGKIEAVADLILWHGGTILGRSELGKQLIQGFNAPPQPTEKPN